jgi:multidrug efflux pump subunit AcrA (membrane-fusion protein)
MRLRLAGTILLLVIGIAAIVVVAFNPFGGTSSAAVRYTTAAATRQDVVKSIVATGTVTPVSTYTLAFGSAATASSASTSNAASNSNSGSNTTWKVLTVAAAPGQVVKKGDVLATADTASAKLAVAVAKANLTAAQQKLATDEAGLSAADRANAKLSVTQASQSLTQAKQSYSSTVAQNKLKMSQQLAALNAAKAKLAADKAAQPPNAAAVAQDESALSNAQNSYNSLKLQVAQSNQQAANQVTSATNQVTSAKYNYSTKTAGASDAQIAADEASVATAQQSYDNAQAALQNATLVSPADGVILTVNIGAGVNAPSGAALTMQSAAFQVSASVAEADFASLKLGQAAGITLTASGLTASGKVTQISPAGTSGSGGGVVSYAILVSLPTPPAGTASGMSAQISVTTAQAANVIAVPAVALVGSAGSYAVRVLDAAGQPQQVTVTVGLVTSSYAEIQSGVEPGTQVVVGTSSTRQNSSTTSGGGFGVPGVGGPGGGGGQFRPGGG